ncbi:MAG: Uma2 family endonuclease [Candidatus Rokuibacteriota bacterium]
MGVRTVILGYDDYAALPSDGRRYEVHEGELSVTPAPTPQHQLITRNLFRLVDDHVRATGAGEILFAPIDVILSDTSIVQPDLVFVERSRLDAISRRGIEGPPTLVVEVLSPSTAVIDRRTKHQLYARYGIPCFWLVDPEARTIEAFVLGPDGYLPAGRATGSEPASFPPFPGLQIVPVTLWP